MNSLLKGFTSIFDWIFPQTYQEMSDDLDNRMQELYDEHGWGKYTNPIKYPCSVSYSHNIAADITRSLENETN